ncbi:MAG: hypothetical protein WCK57_07590 [Verrucomicrobiae bacterium]
MNDLLLVLMGFCLGGSAFLIWALDRIEAYREDCENHRYAAMELSRKLAIANREIERLTEQTNDILNQTQDDADWWKEALK